jgi:glycosyltransferase involved in cell wall biosynthesis
MTNTDPSVKCVSIIATAYNDALVLPHFFEKLQSITTTEKEVHYEIIFVNDASTDSSMDILRNTKINFEDMAIISLSRRFGHMNSILAGLNACKGDAAIYVDVDLQDPLELIPQMVSDWLADQELDVIYTTRKTRTGDSPFQLYSTRIAYRLLRRFISFEFPIDSGDYKLISRRVVDHLTQLSEHEPFFRFLVPWMGFKQKQVFYDRGPRFAGKSHFGFLAILRQFVEISLIPFSLLPLRVIAFSCGLGFVLAIAVVFFLVISLVSGTNTTNDIFTALTCIIIFIAFQFVALGVIGLYVGSIFIESKNRPHYIVDRIE